MHLSGPQELHQKATREAARLPDLVARAQQLAASIILGAHGRRRAGIGDEFWQYRPYNGGDSITTIDWRKSARSDSIFVREREWKLAQAVNFWVGRGASMRWSSAPDLPHKGERAALIALALSMMLLRTGERVGIPNSGIKAKRGKEHARTLASDLLRTGDADYERPGRLFIANHSLAVLVSDFLESGDWLEDVLANASGKGVAGIMIQVLDPAEDSFPFRGRVIFNSPGGTVSHETRRADDLRSPYLQRLQERKELLGSVATGMGWHYFCHRTDDPARQALVQAWQLLKAAAK